MRPLPWGNDGRIPAVESSTPSTHGSFLFGFMFFLSVAIETADSLKDEMDDEEHASAAAVDGADDEDDTVDGVPLHRTVGSADRP